MMLLADFVQARREKRIEAAAVVAREEGLAKGIAKGIEEGRQEGITVGRQEGRQEGITVGRQEGITVGRQEGITVGRQEVYHEIAAWDRRRKEAEERGEPFTEPPPTQPQDTE